MHLTTTYHGLHKWYKDEFEHLGWMVLVKREKITDPNPEKKIYMNEKLKMYIQSIKHLRDTLKEKIDSTEDLDRKKDLLILHRNIIGLLEFANSTLLDSKISNNSKK
jgi:hypothetical protein